MPARPALPRRTTSIAALLHRLAALPALAFAVLLATSTGVRAEGVSTLVGEALPTLPEATPTAIAAVDDGSLVALGTRGAWRLAPGAAAWTTLAPPDLRGSGVRAVLPVGTTAYLLLEDAPASSVARLRLENGRLRVEPLPAWPEPLAQVRLAALGDVLVATGVAGDGRARLYARDPAARDTSWQPRPVWPGAVPAGTLVGQSASLFATVPVGTQAGAPPQLLRWTGDLGWRPAGPVPYALAAGSGRALGQAHVAYPLADGIATLHTITGSWARLPDAALQGAREVLPWKDGFAVFRPAAGGLTAHYTHFDSSTYLLSWIDWAVIAVYLVLMLGIGLHFYLREKRDSTADFFVGGRSIPFWAAGVSLYATNTSSISFIAIPAKAFETNWQYLTNNLVAVVGLVFVAIKIVPLLRRLDLMSVFSYLETRFHPSIRMVASGLAIAMQVGSRMSVILFLPSMAIATITGLDVVWSILIMGGFTIVYTAIGGMKAVIWTDFVQVFVMIGGALFAIGFIVFQLDGGFGEFYSTAMAADKTRLFDFSFDLTKATVWGFIFLVLFDVVLTFPKDQVLMQRTLSTPSDREAGRSIWAFAAIMIPGGFMFYTIGTALYVFYKDHPERLNPMLPIDATFPLFIAAELPPGVTGLIIAGIFAAAMSTMSSIINSVATLASVDFYDRLAKNPTPERSVRFAEWMTVVTGLVAMGLALLLSRYDIHSLFDVSIELAGLLGGGFAGAYTLGMFTRRANAQGVAIGIAGSIVLTLTAWSFDLVHPYFYLAISILLCIVIGYVASLFFPKPTRSLAGLTIYRQDAVPRT